MQLEAQLKRRVTCREDHMQESDMAVVNPDNLNRAVGISSSILAPLPMEDEHPWLRVRSSPVGDTGALGTNASIPSTIEEASPCSPHRSED
eukprot:6658612-Pyramimonas_sp.AAC.1